MSITPPPGVTVRPEADVPIDQGFERRLGLFDATMLVAGTMIGSGIFIVSADIARDVGSSGWLLAVWLMTGVITVMGALSYTELAAMMPNAGGQYVYLREAYSPLWGFLYGWAVFLVIQTGSIAAVGVAFAKFLGVLVPWLGTGDEAILLKLTFAQPLLVQLPLPWLEEPLTVLKRDAFTIHAGQLVAVAIIAGLTLLNCRGVQEGKLVQNTFTLAKTGALILVIVLGLTVATNPAAIQANLGSTWDEAFTTERFASVSKLVRGPALFIALMVAAGAMVGSLFSADAWNNVTFTAGEVKDPRRNLPLSMVYGVGLVITLYLLANLAYLAVLPVSPRPGIEQEVRALRAQAAALEEKGDAKGAASARDQADAVLKKAGHFNRGIALAEDDRVATAVVETWSPKWGAWLMAIAIMISTFGCINGMILMGARLYYAMARDGVFFSFAGKLNGRHVPAWGLILQGIWSVVLVFSGTYGELLDYVIFAALLFYVLTVTGLFVLRYRLPEAERPYRAFGYPLIPALYVFLCAVIMLALLIVRPEYTWPGLIIVLTGIPVYFVWRLVYPRRAPHAHPPY
jgi:APA family basic amino acid/polyamine antiporter